MSRVVENTLGNSAVYLAICRHFILVGAAENSQNNHGRRSTFLAPEQRSSQQSRVQVWLICGLQSLAQGEEKSFTMEQPAGVTTALYPHQLTALCWMLLRENSHRLPPFWEAKKARGTGDTTYKNSLTNFTTGKRPPGSVLPLSRLADCACWCTLP